MDLQDARTLVDYHYWARDRVLNAVQPLSPEQFTRDMGSSFASVRNTVAHVYSSEWLWFSRWRGESPTAVLSPELFPDVATLRATWEAHEAKMRVFFQNLAGDQLGRLVTYKKTDGTPTSAVLWHMLQHMVNHASYHRGQVTTMLRQFGAAPPKSMDMITFYHEAHRAAS